MQTRQHLQKSNMNEGAGVKGVPTTSYNPTGATSDKNHALQTIGSRLCELLIASFAKNVHTDQTTMVHLIGRGLLICNYCTTYSFAKLDRQMFDVCSKRSALEATGRQLLLFLLVQSLVVGQGKFAPRLFCLRNNKPWSN